MTITTGTTNRHPVRRPTGRGSRHVVLAGAVGGLTATVAVEAYAAIARTAGVPMRAGAPGAHIASAVTPASFAVGILVCTFWGTVLALLIAKLAGRPVHTFVRTAILLAALSLISPLTAAHAAPSTRLFLVGAHLLASAIVIPILARRGARTTR
jgi:hypothetical protein